MAEEINQPTVSDSTEVETVDENDNANETKAQSAEAAMDVARAQAEARRKRILEKANNRMQQVNGEKVQDEDEKKASLSNAARIRAARQRRRYGKKSATVTATEPTTSATPSAPSTTESSAAEASGSTSNPDTGSEKVQPEDIKETTPDVTSEATTATTNATPSATETQPTTKKKYVGVARMRRKMLVKKKMEEENNDAGGSTSADSGSAKASLASSKGKTAASTASVGNGGLPHVKVQTVPIYMHIVVILLLFIAGFDVGIQQFHVDVDVRTQVAVQEYGLPFVHRNPLQPLKPLTVGKNSKEALEEKLSSSSSSSGGGDVRDEFDEEIDFEYTPPNIDPIFRVDLDELTKGPGFLNQMARGAIAIHRLILWFFYYAPISVFSAIISIPTAFIQSPPALFAVAIILRQVIGKSILGATIPEESGDDGTDGAKQKNIEVISMAKNFVKNFFMTTFPTLVKIFDAYLHLKADMYVVLCGVFFGLAWTHLNNDALSSDTDAIMSGGDASEGEL